MVPKLFGNKSAFERKQALGKGRVRPPKVVGEKKEIQLLLQ